MSSRGRCCAQQLLQMPVGPGGISCDMMEVLIGDALVRLFVVLAFSFFVGERGLAYIHFGASALKKIIQEQYVTRGVYFWGGCVGI